MYLRANKYVSLGPSQVSRICTCGFKLFNIDFEVIQPA